MNVGGLRHRVRIEQRDDGLDGAGQPVDVWAEVFTAWASIEDQRSRQIVESTQVPMNEEVSFVTIRYRPGVLPEMRLVETCHAGRVWDITGIRDRRGRGRELELEAKERRFEVEAAT